MSPPSDTDPHPHPKATTAEEPIVSDQPVGTEPPRNNDFVIREGFPALRLPGNKNNGPWIDGDEPIPRHSFWADGDALTYHHLEDLWQDCETVFSARARDSDQAYSAGVTYFSPCQMKPRCALEALVLSIFRKHTDGLDAGVFIPEQSGAEWWTLVLDEDKVEEEASKKQGDDDHDDDDEEEGDEVGLHFDADYGLEDQAPNLLLHPRLATVTYLTDFGAPTVVLDQRSPPPNDVEKKTLQGSIRKGWLSHPKIGKHMAFDGRLLHGAPASFFPSMSDATISKTAEPPLKKAKLQARKRITLLVNIWLNHCPMDAELLDDDICAQLKTPHEMKGKSDESIQPPFVWKSDLDLARPTKLVNAKLVESPTDPAGEEEVVICSRLVTAIYGASAESFHSACAQGDLVELEFEKGALSLEVGDVVQSDEDETDNETEE